MAISILREVDQTEDVHDTAIHIRAIYVAPALVLPEDLTSFASCHGLTYLQPVQRLDGDNVLVHAAPLAHRLSMPGKYYSCVLPESALNIALVYDRRLAGLPTCDLRELLEERAAQTAPIVTIAMVEDCKVENGNDEDGEEEEADLVPLPTLFVSRQTIRESLETLHITTSKDRCVQTALLHAVLETLSIQMNCCSTRERRRLQRSYDEVCAVQQWRRQRREKGHGWQRVVTLEESWHKGRAGWDIIVGVPVSQVA
jgi:hypothetical protein